MPSAFLPMYALTIGLMTVMFTFVMSFRDDKALRDRIVAVSVVQPTGGNGGRHMKKRTPKVIFPKPDNQKAEDVFAELNRMMKQKARGSMENHVIHNGLFATPQPPTLLPRPVFTPPTKKPRDIVKAARVVHRVRP